MYKLYQDKYNEETQAFMLAQTGRRRRSEYDNGVMRVPVQSPSPTNQEKNNMAITTSVVCNVFKTDV